MNASKFRQHLNNSLVSLLDVTRELCYNELSENFKFIIQPSGREFHDGLNAFERKNLTKLNRYAGKLLHVDQVVNLLCHEDKVPLWINTTVYESKENLTVIYLLCSRRLRPDTELFYKVVEYPPFNVMVPLPPDPLRKDINGKFDINWKKQLHDRRKPGNIVARIRRFLAIMV